MVEHYKLKDPNRPEKPLREFSNAGAPHRSLLRMRLELLWYLAMPAVVIAGIVLMGIWGYSAIENKDSALAFQSEAEVVDLSGSKQTVLRDYLTAKGGEGVIRGLKKVYIEGTCTNPDGLIVFSGSVDFSGNAIIHLLSLDRPISLEFKDGVLVTGTDSMPDLDVEPIKTMVMAFYDPMLDAEPAADAILNVEMTTVLGERTLRLKLESEKVGINAELDLSAATLTLLQRRDISDDYRERVYRYSNYKKVGGVKLPFTIIGVDGNGAMNRINFRDIYDGNLAYIAP